jgi:hypothetical protein
MEGEVGNEEVPQKEKTDQAKLVHLFPSAE